MNHISKEFLKELFLSGIHKIYEYINSLFQEKLTLIEKIKELEATIFTLKEELKKYKEKEAKTSKNSSKSPSSDPFYKKNNKRNIQDKTNRNQGGQKGHEGRTLNQVENPDDRKYCHVNYCKCGHHLSDNIVREEKRQVFDIKHGKIFVMEYVIEVIKCPKCGCICKGEVPEGVTSPVQYGEYIKCIGVYLVCYQMIPYQRASEVFEDIFGHYVSPATIYKWEKECFDGLSEYEKAILKMLILSRVLHVDETMLNVNKVGMWLLSYSTKHITYFTVSEKKDKDAMDAVGILPGFTGFLVHDYYSVYFQYTSCFHILCNAHHLRDLNFIYEIQEQIWGQEMILLLIKIKKAVEKAKELELNSLEPSLINAYTLEYNEILERAEQNNPRAKREKGQRGRVKQTKSRNLLDRFIEHSDSILKFMSDFTVPFDNNQVERDHRMMKTHQKVSGCFRSKEGADYFACCRGYISTLKKNKQNVLEGIHLVFRGKPFIPKQA